MTVDLAIALPTLVAGATLIALVIGGILKIRKWIEALASSSRATAEQLKTSDNLTIADHVQHTARSLDSINDNIAELRIKTAENRETAIGAMAVANHAHRRLDDHLVHDHGATLAPPPEEN